VAQDPVLLQPITNGHAARMRFARFRTTVSGGDTQKKHRSSEKSRVSKSKAKKDNLIKSESSASLSSYAQVCTFSPRMIKQGCGQRAHKLKKFSPASAASPYLTDRDDFNARFLTPCSDDMTHGLGINPAAVEKVNRQTAADYSPSLGFMDAASLAHSPTFSAFDDASLDFNAFTADSQSHGISDLHAQSLADCPDWNDRLHLQY
jgi:hypothetical protein